MENKKLIYNNINFLKLILVLIIVYYHIVSGKLSVIYPSVEIFNVLGDKIYHAGHYTILLFFIVSGYFLSKSVNKNGVNIKNFVCKKLIRLFPMLFFSTFTCAVCSYWLPVRPELQSMILNVFFIHNYSGGAQYTSFNAASWFVCALFWISLFYYSIVFIVKDKFKTNFIIACICIISFFALIIPFFGNENPLRFKIIPYRDLFAFLGIGLGYLLENLNIKKDIVKNYFINNFFVGITEFAIFLIVILPLILNCKVIKEPLLYIIAFLTLLILFIRQKGFFSKLLNLSFFSKISKPSFSIYMMQETCFIVLQCSFWKTAYPNFHPILAFVYSFLFCIIIGVLAYNIIEKPVTKILSSKYIRNGEEISNNQPSAGT